MKNIVDKVWLRTRLNLEDLVVVDCRFSLANPEAGEAAYQNSHIPGAVYAHLEKNLSGPVLEHGGRHPLPDLETFSLFLGSLGISNRSVVIAYDSGEGAFAARFWWMMKYVGHKDVFVLNGGFKEWETSGFSLDDNKTIRERVTYEINLQPQMLATYEDVKEIVEQDTISTILIDSREPRRFLGLEEPIDKVAGRIPGAINKFWVDGLDNGRFKSLDEQRGRFSDVSPTDSVIVYCGSGVTATPNYLLLNELGYQNLKIYIGSYSDWVSYKHNKVEKN
jgi:thiosulfate/3-mercaptopyruvate sulfurtransferase